MKYFRSQNLNPAQVRDLSVWKKTNGDIELNPTSRVIINGDLVIEGNVPGPEVTNVLYVTLDGDDANSGRGEGPDQAKRSIKSALEAADQGTTIYVRSGEYIEDNPLVVPPKVSIIGDNLRRTIVRPLNGTTTLNISNVSRTNQIVTITTSTSHNLVEGDRVRIRCATQSAVDETDVNILDVIGPTQFRYRQSGANIPSTSVPGGINNTVKKGTDLFLVNSQSYIAQMVFKGVPAPAYCVNIDSDAIVDTSPYIQNCSNINGPWMRNGQEWLPFITEQPDAAGTFVSGPRPLLDDEIDPLQVDVYGIDIEGAGGGMLIDGDRYSTQSPIKSMVADAFTQVAQGAIGFHITNFGYMQLVSCFAVFCSKAFYTTRGGYLSISNSVIDFGTEGFVADGYYLDPYGSGTVNADYYSTVGSVTVNTEGSGFTVAPTVTIDPPTTPGGVQAQAEASIDPILGIINAITVTDPGSGYDFQPTVTITPANGATATVNLAKNLSIDVAELANKPQVGSIMFLGTDPTAYYVSNTTTSTLSFRYDEQKCRRDIGLILDAVLTDMIFDSNHQSVYAGLSYLRSYSSKVTSLQKTQTIDALYQAKNEVLTLTSNITAQNRISSNFDIVINIINLGVAATPTVLNSPIAAGEPGFYEAAQILLANKEFIVDELVAFINLNYPVLASTYNQLKCERDVRYILDAICYDLIYGGNTQTINAALSYAEGSVIDGQIEETQQTYEYWKTILGPIVKNTLITKTVGNTSTQNTSISPGSPVDPDGPGNAAEELMQIVIDVIDNGTGYVPDPVTRPTYTNADDPLLVIERTNILADLADIQEVVIDYLNITYGGIVTVFTVPAIQNVLSGTDVKFHNVSTISTGGTALEYVGSGVTYNALPFFGGEPDPTKERIEINNGKCFTVSNDQVGNYRIGEFFTVNAITGAVTIDAENISLSGLAAIGPFRRNGIPVGVQLREVSNNANLVSSTGSADVNTVPTQPAVQTYVENRYLNKVTTNDTTVAGANITFTGDLAINGGELYSTATTFNLLNRDNKDSISEDGPETVNAFLNANEINIGHTTGTSYFNGNLEVKGSILSTTQSSVDLLNTTATTVNAFGAASILNLGDDSGTATISNSIITFPNATNVNINGANPTIASTSTGTLTLFDTLITTVNAFRTATAITFGEASGTLTIQSANTVTNGDLQIKGGDLTTNQLTFNLLNTTATTVNAFGTATAVSIGAGSGTTTVQNSLQVNLNSTLGVDTTSSNTFRGLFTASLRDNTTSALDITEASNSYIKINTNNTTETITFGATPTVSFLNVTDATSTTVAGNTFAGGVGIAKKLFVGSDLTVNGSTVVGDDRTADTHSFNGTLTVNVPDNNAVAVQITENTTPYITVITTDTNENITFEATPKVIIKNASDSSTKDTGALVVDGGVGIEKNLTVGVDLQVDRDITATGDLSVNGGDFNTTATTFNLINANATTVNFAGAGTSITVGATSGTTRVRNNLDVDGDVNIDGGDLTVSTGTFNLANTTATILNIGGVGTEFNFGVSASAGTVFTVGSSSNSGNTFKLSSNNAGTINYTTDVTSGTVNAWQSVSGNINIGLSGNIHLGTGSGNTTTTEIGGAITGNTLKINSVSSGTINLDTDVTSGVVNEWTSVTGTINFGGTGTTVNLGTTTGNTTLEVRGNATTGTATVRTNAGVTTVELFNGEATTVNFAGAATDVQIGAATGTTNINNNLDVDGDVNIDGGDLTVSTSTFNLANTTASTVNAFGAANTVNIGGSGGSTTIKNADTILDGDLTVKGGDIKTDQVSFNILNDTATTINFGGAATDIQIGAATGTTNINNNLDVDGDINIDGGDLTVSTTTFNLANTTATTGNMFGAATTVNIGAAGGSGILTIRNDSVVLDGDLQVKGGDLTTNQTTFNLLNTTATTVNAFGAATLLELGAATGTTNINNNLDVDGDVNIDGDDLTTSAATFNLLNATATTINFGGAATAINIGVASPTALTTVKHDLKVDGDLSVDGTLNLGNDVTIAGDLAVNGGDLTTTATTFNLINANATTVNFAGAATAIEIGASTGTTNINNDLDVDGDINFDGGDITSSAVTVNLLATTTTTVNAFGAATALNLGAATGTTIVKNSLEVDLNTTLNGTLTVDQSATVTGDLAVNGGDLTTNQATFNLLNTNVTSGNLFGVATAVNIGNNAASANTLTVGPAISGNTVKIQSTSSGTINLTTDVTNGTVNAWQSVTGTINIGAYGNINLGTSSSDLTTVTIGGAFTGNTLKLAGVSTGIVAITSDVTTGTVDVFNNVTTGTVNVAGAGASTINLGGAGSTVNIRTLTLTTDLEVQYGGTGRGTFTTNGVIYGNATDGLLVTAASNPGVSNAITSYGILTTDASNVPVWTDTIDGGSY